MDGGQAEQRKRKESGWSKGGTLALGREEEEDVGRIFLVCWLWLRRAWRIVITVLRARVLDTIVLGTPESIVHNSR